MLLFSVLKARGVLRIPNVDRSDEGRYVCTDDNGKMQYVKLVIAGKHIICTNVIMHSGGNQFVFGCKTIF